MARPQKFRHSREALTDPQIAAKLGGLVLDIEALRTKRKQIDDQLAAAFDAVDDAGFEKKFVRKVVSLRAKETDARRDEEEGLEAYEFAIEKGVSLACARSKRDLPAHNPETGELTDTQEQPETRADNGANIVTRHLNINVSPSPETPQAIADDEAAQAQTSSAPILTPSGTILPAMAVKAPEAVSLPASGAALSEADVPAFLRKSAADYRPHCQHPDNCGSSNPTGYCYQCRKDMEAAETEAA